MELLPFVNQLTFYIAKILARSVANTTLYVGIWKLGVNL